MPRTGPRPKPKEPVPPPDEVPLSLEATADVVQALGTLSDAAIEAWQRAMHVAAERGDHRPARDLLLAAQKITAQQKDGTGGVTVNVGLALPGLPQGTPMKQIEGTREK